MSLVAVQPSSSEKYALRGFRSAPDVFALKNFLMVRVLMGKSLLLLLKKQRVSTSCGYFG